MSAEDKLVCSCQGIWRSDIAKILYEADSLADMDAAFDLVQKGTGCGSICGKCRDQVFEVIADLMYEAT